MKFNKDQRYFFITRPDNLFVINCGTFFNELPKYEYQTNRADGGTMIYLFNTIEGKRSVENPNLVFVDVNSAIKYITNCGLPVYFAESIRTLWEDR